MKKIFVLVAVLVLGAATANAQGRWYVGTTNLGSSNDLMFTGFVTTDGSTQWGVAPEVGFNINPRWSVGLGLGYADLDNKETNYGVNPYVRWFAVREGRFGLYLQGDFKYFCNDQDGTTSDVIFGGILPGVSYQLSSRFGINASFGTLGYVKAQDEDGIFGFDLSANTLNFGLTFSF